MSAFSRASAFTSMAAIFSQASACAASPHRDSRAVRRYRPERASLRSPHTFPRAGLRRAPRPVVDIGIAPHGAGGGRPLANPMLAALTARAVFADTARIIEHGAAVAAMKSWWRSPRRGTSRVRSCGRTAAGSTPASSSKSNSSRSSSSSSMRAWVIIPSPGKGGSWVGAGPSGARIGEDAPPMAAWCPARSWAKASEGKGARHRSPRCEIER